MCPVFPLHWCLYQTLWSSFPNRNSSFTLFSPPVFFPFSLTSRGLQQLLVALRKRGLFERSRNLLQRNARASSLDLDSPFPMFFFLPRFSLDSILFERMNANGWVLDSAIKPLSSEIIDISADGNWGVGRSKRSVRTVTSVSRDSRAIPVYYFHDEILTGDRSSFDDSSSIFRMPLVARLRFFIQPITWSA